MWAVVALASGWLCTDLHAPSYMLLILTDADVAYLTQKHVVFALRPIVMNRVIYYLSCEPVFFRVLFNDS